MFFDIHEQLPGVDISNSAHFHLPPWHFLKCLPAYSINNRPRRRAAQEHNTTFSSQERGAYLRSSLATNRDISPHDFFISPLCFSHINTHLKLMKPRLTAWNVPYRVKGVGGLELRLLRLPAPEAGRQWISMNESAQLQDVSISQQITRSYILWIVWFLWPETDGGGFLYPCWVWRGEREASIR